MSADGWWLWLRLSKLVVGSVDDRLLRASPNGRGLAQNVKLSAPSTHAAVRASESSLMGATWCRLARERGPRRLWVRPELDRLPDLSVRS